MSFNYWTMRNTTPYQKPIKRVIEVKNRSYDRQMGWAK